MAPIPIQSLYSFQAVSDIRDYSPTVLDGNWNELRYRQAVNPHAVVPCVLAQRECKKKTTTFHDSYPYHGKNDQITDDFLNIKCTSFKRKEAAATSRGVMRLLDEFQENLTSMNDILFKLVPKLPEPVFEDGIPRARKIDTLQCYGNQTNFGLREWIKCKVLKEAFRTFHLSEYKQSYVNPKTIKIIPFTRI
ncbi:uncharacterized protein LOC119667750 [Teleopsis dalmanni]|uniref:uncharacterized protein LOC119667750 n=1 Tax=Teleopsis dalmanni TaxID=139649 RepID=UPI0018CE6D26|nr:uncharacterized protein LOC119667750 [Teleopsis dalmanni]